MELYTNITCNPIRTHRGCLVASGIVRVRARSRVAAIYEPLPCHDHPGAGTHRAVVLVSKRQHNSCMVRAAQASPDSVGFG